MVPDQTATTHPSSEEDGFSTTASKLSHIPMVSIVADLVGLEILHEAILSLPNFPTSFSTCRLDASVREQDSRNNIKIKVYVMKNSYLRDGG